MAATATGQPPPEVGLITSASVPGGTYTEKLKPKSRPYQSIPLKPITYLHGESQVIWEHEEVNQMIVNENLEYAVIGTIVAERASSSERTISEVRSRIQHSDPKKLQNSIENAGLVTKNKDVGGRISKGKECEVRSQNMLISDNGEARVNCQEEGEILKGPNLIEDEEEVIQHKKDTEEDEDMDYNIQQISKAGDLSPRHTNSLKYKARKGRPVIPLQVKTRSSRDRGSSIDQ
uniref:Uncharacterized protein n=1 Tax=Solanum tuberosum TaxID=4113 RepID=M1DJV0_SOLTU